MADINSIVRRVRSRVHDVVSQDNREDGRPLYLDSYYIDSIDSGMGRINLDLDSAYTIGSLPVKYEYLLELRATINMCYVRGGEGASGDVEDFPNVPDAIVTVPQLSVQRQQMPLEGPKYWLKMAEKLDSEYQDTLMRLQDRGDEGPEIQQYTMSRMSLRTGRRMPYVYDKPITAPEFSVSVNSGTVTLNWSVIYNEYFRLYEIERSENSDFSTKVVVFSTSDNQVSSFKQNPGNGTYYYRLKITNSNDLYSYTQASSVVVL